MAVRTNGIGTYKEVTGVYTWCSCFWQKAYPVIGLNREEEVAHLKTLAKAALKEHKKTCKI